MPNIYAGVNLWNISSSIKDDANDAGHEVVAACKSYPLTYSKKLDGSFIVCGFIVDIAHSETSGLSPNRGRIGAKTFHRKLVLSFATFVRFSHMGFIRKLSYTFCNWQARLALVCPVSSSVILMYFALIYSAFCHCVARIRSARISRYCLD